MSLEHDPYTSLTEFGSLSFIIFVQFRPVIPVQKLLIRRCTGDAVNISVTVLVDVIRSHAHIDVLPISGLVTVDAPDRLGTGLGDSGEACF